MLDMHNDLCFLELMIALLGMIHKEKQNQETRFLEEDGFLVVPFTVRPLSEIGRPGQLGLELVADRLDNCRPQWQDYGTPKAHQPFAGMVRSI